MVRIRLPPAASPRTFGLSAEDAGFSSRLECHSSDSKIDRPGIDYFLATPHRAVNHTGGERYALAFFCDAHIDWPIAAVPTCVGPDKPPKYPTTYYTDYMVAYQKRTYDLLQAAE